MQTVQSPPPHHHHHPLKKCSLISSGSLPFAKVPSIKQGLTVLINAAGKLQYGIIFSYLTYELQEIEKNQADVCLTTSSLYHALHVVLYWRSIPITMLEVQANLRLLYSAPGV